LQFIESTSQGPEIDLGAQSKMVEMVLDFKALQGEKVSIVSIISIVSTTFAHALHTKWERRLRILSIFVIWGNGPVADEFRTTPFPKISGNY
jgi:hypothetical protein